MKDFKIFERRKYRIDPNLMMAILNRNSAIIAYNLANLFDEMPNHSFLRWKQI